MSISKQSKQFFKKILNEKYHLYKIRAQGRSVKTIEGQKNELKELRKEVKEKHKVITKIREPAKR